MHLEKCPVQFFTAVCYEWMNLLMDDESKLILIDALKFRIEKRQVKVCAYVIMPNHIHLIWRVQSPFTLQQVQRDFLKFAAKKIIERVQLTSGVRAFDNLFVGLKDRNDQVWKRHSMSIDLIHNWFFAQKLNYLHHNPCQPHWNLTEHPCDYRFSSARFYEEGFDEFNFLNHPSDL